MTAIEPLFLAAFSVWGSAITWLEIAAFVLSLWMVVCNMRVAPLAWPLAIAASLAYALLFAHSRLYGETGLQFVFIAVSFWGWWQWLRGRQADGRPLQVRALEPRTRWILAAATLAAWPVLGLTLRHATDTDVPFWDGLTTTGSLAGQWLLGRKHIETWPVWIAVNVASVGLFAYKGLWLTVLLYALFALMSVAGWRAWSRMASDGRAPLK